MQYQKLQLSRKCFLGLIFALITTGGVTAAPLFTGNGGKGLVIAVPTPTMTGGNQTNSWMPQLFQDLITADLPKYSAMTVIDRRNESLILAEQRISASGNYSEADYISIGRLTNARYIVVGNILVVSGRYSVTFRINNTIMAVISIRQPSDFMMLTESV